MDCDAFITGSTITINHKINVAVIAAIAIN